ncbi:MAG: YgjV family protein, partial [Eubacterium sp.]|nr:YgjV family protein [Candidatus Colimonas fimequi]
MYQIFVQALGFAGLAGFFVSFQIKSNKALFGCQTFAACMFCLQFALLGGLTGAMNQIVMIIRNGMMTQYHRWQWL